MSTGMLVAVTAAGAVWRWWDGRGENWHPSVTRHTLVRLLVVAVLAAFIGYDVMGGWGLVPAAIAVLSIHMSPVKFMNDATNWLMTLRYAVPAVAPSWFGVYEMAHGGQTYVLACLVAGLSYAVLRRFASGKIHEYGPELITGGAVIGGLATL